MKRYFTYNFIYKHNSCILETEHTSSGYLSWSFFLCIFLNIFFSLVLKKPYQEPTLEIHGKGISRRNVFRCMETVSLVEPSACVLLPASEM